MITDRKASRGAAAVEFAIVLPVLLLLVMGSVEWGFYFFQQQVVVNAAREGARAGSVTQGATYLESAEAVAAASLSAGRLDGARSGIEINAVDGTVEGRPSVIVTVTYPLRRLTGIDVAVPSTATARSEMRR